MASFLRPQFTHRRPGADKRIVETSVFSRNAGRPRCRPRSSEEEIAHGYQFSIRGSSPEPYVVVFKAGSARLTASCTCQAGQQQQACKHRVGILEGDITELVSENPDEVKLVAAALAGTELQRTLQTVMEGEQAVTAAKAQLTAAKRMLSRVMHA
jgi:hypothetical protein